MKRNIGTLDMAVRLVIAALLFAVGFLPNPLISPGLSQDIIGWFGLVPLVTGLTRYCPLYTLVGMSTRATKDKGAGSSSSTSTSRH